MGIKVSGGRPVRGLLALTTLLVLALVAGSAPVIAQGPATAPLVGMLRWLGERLAEGGAAVVFEEQLKKLYGEDYAQKLDVIQSQLERQLQRQARTSAALLHKLQGLDAEIDSLHAALAGNRAAAERAYERSLDLLQKVPELSDQIADIRARLDRAIEDSQQARDDARIAREEAQQARRDAQQALDESRRRNRLGTESDPPGGETPPAASGLWCSGRAPGRLVWNDPRAPGGCRLQMCLRRDGQGRFLTQQLACVRLRPPR